MMVSSTVLYVVLGIWSLALAWAGFTRRFLLGCAIVLAGLALNAYFISQILETSLISPSAVMVQVSGLIYAGVMLGAGWVLSRFINHARAENADDPDV